MKSSVRKDHYYACRYTGENGDLIVGRVKSVRRDGEVILFNLLTAKPSVKDAAVLLRRNKRIAKADAEAILVLYNQTLDDTVAGGNITAARAAARAAAIRTPEYNSTEQPALPVEEPVTIAPKPKRISDSDRDFLRLMDKDLLDVVSQLEKTYAHVVSMRMALKEWFDDEVSDLQRDEH